MRITERDLKPGDVLLYNGTSWIVWAIKRLDGGKDDRKVSHAGLYLGNGRVGEALMIEGSFLNTDSYLKGVVKKPLSDSIRGCEWVRVVRHITSIEGDNMGPVLQKAEEILAERERYAINQIFLLAFVCSARRVKYNSSFLLRQIAQKTISTATFLLERCRSDNREPMICSEFVYRSFDQALPPDQDRYSIQIGSHKNATEGPQKRRRLFRPFGASREIPVFSAIEPGSLLAAPPVLTATAMATTVALSENFMSELEDLIQQYHDAIETNRKGDIVCGATIPGDDAISIEELARLAQSFADTLVKQELLAYALAASAPALSQKITPDFVTPGDLLKSPSLREVGDLFP